MASELRVNTLKDASGNNSIGMSYVAEGSAKAWVNFNGTTVTAAADLTGVQDSFNIASLVDNDPGDYTVNFSTNMLTADYAVAPTGGAQLFMNATYAASNCTVDNRNLAGTQTDGTNINVTIFGDLAS